jgi:Rhodopirellula transposase DDE domain
MIDEAKVAERFAGVGPELNERQRRLWAASEARALGYGGIAAVSRATGISEDTVGRGLKELAAGERLEAGQVRRRGAGRPALTVSDPTLLEDLQRLVDPDTRGDPESPLRWCSKSLGKIAGALAAAGHQVSDRSAGKLLRGLGFRLHANQKTREGKDHPDRDAQFRHINETARAALDAGVPVISVDAKKRELVGDFKAVGREYEPTGRPVEVRCHDFKDKDLGHAIPYGVYDIKANEGMVSVGITNDTSAFAVNSIRSWWQHLGHKRYPKAKTLTITADGGGSNSSRTRLWKTELQKLANELQIAIRVCHFPPGTSKWNKIEHRMFSYVSLNWRGRPLESLQVIIDLIGSATTSTGLKIYSRLDPGHYEKGIKVTDAELAAVNIVGDEFHPDWNYTIHPTPPTAVITS